MLDIEYAPKGDKCYGLTHSQMVAWVSDFVETYKASTSQYPILYTTADWWKTCTGNAGGFGKKCPLSLARYNTSPGTVPNDWPTYTFWQNSDKYQYGGDSQIFNGGIDQLKKIAHGS